MNNKFKKIFITFLIILLSFLSFNIKADAAASIGGVYPIKDGYEKIKYQYKNITNGGTTYSATATSIGIYYVKTGTGASGSDYKEVFCLEPQKSMRVHSADTTQYLSQYLNDSRKTEMINQVVAVVTNWLSGDSIKELLDSTTDQYLHVKLGAEDHGFERQLAAQGLIWEIVTGERTSFSTEVPYSGAGSSQTTTDGNGNKIYKSFYAMIKNEPSLGIIHSNYITILYHINAYYNANKIGKNADCSFYPTGGNNNHKCELQLNGDYYEIPVENEVFGNLVDLPDGVTYKSSGNILTLQVPKSMSIDADNPLEIKMRVFPSSVERSYTTNLIVYKDATYQDVVSTGIIPKYYSMKVYTVATSTPETPNKTYHLRVRKVDETGQPLSGAKFKWKYCVLFFGCETGYLTEGTNGYYYATGLKNYGDYDITEEEAPEGYTKTNSFLGLRVRNFDLDGTNSYSNNTVFTDKLEGQQKYYQVRIKKIDSATNAPLAGAKFEVEHVIKEKKYESEETDENGYVTVMVEDTGYYNVKEIKTPEGYTEYKNNFHMFSVNSNAEYGSDKYAEVTLKNDALTAPRYQIAFQKLKQKQATGSSSEPHANVQFGLYTSQNESSKIATITTDDNGYGYYDEVPETGTYYLKETYVPNAENYIANTTWYEVVVGENNKVAEGNTAAQPSSPIINYIKPEEQRTIYYRAAIRKVDSVTGVGIKGAKFTLKQGDKDVEACKSLVSDEEGIVVCDKLTEVGDYVFEEEKAAEGYTYNMSKRVTKEVTIGTKNLTENTFDKNGLFVLKNTPTTGKLIKYTVDDNFKRVKWTRDGCGTSAYDTADYAGPIFEISPILENGKKGSAIKFNKYEDGKYIKSSSGGSSEVKTCNGEFEVLKLPQGKYEVCETKAPKDRDDQGGYYETNCETLEISETEESPAVYFQNTPKYEENINVINFKKKNEDGQIISNGAFALQYKTSKGYVDVPLVKLEDIYYVVDDENEENEVYQMEEGNGEYLIVNVPPGEYRIVERQAPEGYELITDANSKAIVTVDDTGKQYNVEMVDRKTNVDGSSSTAELVITISTGRKVLNYVLIISGLALALGCLILIRKKIKK